MEKLFISAVAAQGFHRCATFFPQSGKLCDAGDFDKTDWQRLKDEPNLRCSLPTEAQLANQPENAAEQRAAKIAEAIRTLTADDYQKDGKPKVDAINELIGDDIGKVTTVERNDVWAALLEDRFEAPSPTG